MSDCYVCIHGHFYQPPRENPWTDEIEAQESSAPFHDWNERVTAECYSPNAFARILDENGRVERVVNNYARISFNFGATLFTWMERHAPAVYAAILEADRDSRERWGHGNAIAQAYNHIILPLANQRDQRTQVIWGVRDFEYRFGRRPDGMWLPETAVNTASLEALAEQGVAFTILAPHQAKRIRRLRGRNWQDTPDASIDTRCAYRVRLPSRRSIAVFFYNGSLSHSVAFENLTANGGAFAERLLGGIGEGEGPLVCHIATDGETYGHHHRYGEMGLAFALDMIDAGNDATLTNYATFLDEHPAEYEVEINEDTSWSCTHGVERWRSDCGCNMGEHHGWNQAWRAPLRESLDWLRDELAARFEAEAAPLLRDPWQARDGYIDIIIDRQNTAAFLSRSAARDLDEAEQSRALALLEMQRQAILMFASCAWFFDDVSGIETLQALAHAARAIQLARETTGDDLEPAFLERLAAAKSNVPEEQDAAASYRRHIKPMVVSE